LENKTFGKDVEEYGLDGVPNRPNPKLYQSYKGIDHSQPFKYTNESRHIRKTLNKHEDYIPEGPGESALERIGKKIPCKPWKAPYKRKAKPNESIQKMYRNRDKRDFRDL